MSKVPYGNCRKFIVNAASTVTATAIAGSLVACNSDSISVTVPPRFPYGVASGDPLSDRVILWTYAKIPNSAESIDLIWQVATDNNFTSIVSTGKVTANEASSFTAKVYATGLSAGADYFYRFMGSLNSLSSVGATRTLPASNVSSIKLAVFPARCTRKASLTPKTPPPSQMRNMRFTWVTIFMNTVLTLPSLATLMPSGWAVLPCRRMISCHWRIIGHVMRNISPTPACRRCTPKCRGSLFETIMNSPTTAM